MQDELFPRSAVARRKITFHFADGQVIGEDGVVRAIGEARDQLHWVSALPSSGAPHQYTVREWRKAEPWDILSCVIAGSPDSFLAYHRGYQRPNRYWEFDGFRFWQTGASNGKRGVTLMLNRGTIEADTPRRVDDGAKPVHWEGPPWLEFGSAWPPGRVVRRDGSSYYDKDRDPRQKYRCRNCARSVYFEANWPCRFCGTAMPEEME